MSENTKPATSTDPTTQKPTEGSNGRPSPAPAAAPAKKFSPVDDRAKRGPGRPPKIAPARGSGAQAAERTGASPASVSAPASPAYTAKPDPGLAGAGVRGLLQMTSAFSATVSHFALKIDFLQALQIWQFSEAELKRIEGPGALFMEKYAPVLDGYGLELEFAAAILPILSGKIFAIIAAKRALEAKRIPQPTDRPAKPATVTEIRPAVAPDSAQPATEQTHQQSEAASTARAESPGAPPSAFTHAAVDSSAELVTM